jgi:transcriptional regulator with XRE-family HTH domain
MSGVIDDITIGTQIRDLRKARGLTLEDLAARINRSVGYLSQVERDISDVTIPNLKDIAEALGVSVNWFFRGDAIAPEDERGLIVRRSNRRRLEFRGTGVLEELLSPTLTGAFEMVLGTFEPGGDTGEVHAVKNGEEAGFVVSGQLALHIYDKKYTIEAGDAFMFPRNIPHKAWNPTDEKTVVLWIIAPPVY